MDPKFDTAYFESNYPSYERQTPPRKLAFYRQLVEQGRDVASPGAILEIGCAFGHFLETLGEAWKRHGVDASDEALREARRRLPDARLEQSSGSDIPIDGPFDVIAAFDVLEHIRDLDAMREQIRRRLRPSGRVVFVVPVYDGPLGPLVHLLDRDSTHIHKQSRRFWLSWAEGPFAVVDWCGVFRYLLPTGQYIHRPTRRFRRVAPAIAVVSRLA